MLLTGKIGVSTGGSFPGIDVVNEAAVGSVLRNEEHRCYETESESTCDFRITIEHRGDFVYAIGKWEIKKNGNNFFVTVREPGSSHNRVVPGGAIRGRFDEIRQKPSEWSRERWVSGAHRRRTVRDCRRCGCRDH